MARANAVGRLRDNVFAASCFVPFLACGPGLGATTTESGTTSATGPAPITDGGIGTSASGSDVGSTDETGAGVEVCGNGLASGGQWCFEQLDVPQSQNVRGVIITDLDADGRGDLGFFVGDSASTVIAVTWTGTTLTVVGQAPMDVSVYPLRAGRLDAGPPLVLAGFSNGPELVHTFRFSEGTLNVQQTPLPAAGTGYPWEYWPATTIDVDGDGFHELLVYDPYPYPDIGKGGAVPRLLKRNPNGWELIGDELPALDYKSGPAVASADLTGDRRPELVLSRDLGDWHRGADPLGVADYDPARDQLLSVAFDNGVAVPVESIASGTVAYRLATADFDGDGAIDIAAIGYDAVAMLRGRGDGTFDPPRLLELEADYVAAGDGWGTRIGDGVAGDFDGDGDQELLLAAGAVGAPEPPYGNLIIVDDPLGAATLHVLAAGAVITSLTSDKIAVGDVNGDGVDDIAAMTRIALGELGLFLLLSDP